MYLSASVNGLTITSQDIICAGFTKYVYIFLDNWSRVCKDTSVYMFRLFTIVIEFPALDRWREFLEARQQRQIDALTQRLAVANAALRGSVANSNKETT